MIFTELDESLVRPGMTAENKDDVVDQMLQMLAATGKVGDVAAAREALIANEQRTATGMQHGIAIPHAKTEAVDELLACVAVTTKPIDCSAVDGKPSRIFIMTLSPPDRVGPHIRFLSEIGRILKSRKVRDRVLKAATPAELLQALGGKPA
ncbi:PTS sugar transporter subunit IIA [Spirochaeta africana]|uniref:Phosphotransferase system mannitol/fructose-specifc IIA component (Ntr-type) n=1 Tax=Spirochaeta africana (strain ATCC 700263 / DSM 8902 / Z-7692) TaxID=889378 RepID=H9ULG8_SPIAZ|nr:PTS sugar transporter subunit IIA [Spirochaeta africana]AFG38361.1 phosphotransferase system mannitol/fructose-specifc IIA component (Ntr-type) [Spirochaeta africana DSM 8902]